MSAFDQAMAGLVKSLTNSPMARTLIVTQKQGDVTVKGIFTKGQSLEEARPQVVATVYVNKLDLAARPGDRLTVDGVVYDCFEVEDDGIGGLTLFLRFMKRIPT
jgi:hypothetical protein